MRRGRTKLTPGFLSVGFGVFLLFLSGVSGLYVPQGTSESANSAQPTETAAPAEIVAPSPVSEESPTALPTQPPTSTPSRIEATPTPTPTATASPTASPTRTATATPAKLVHVVKSGETLLDIAEDYGVSVDALLEANDIDDPDALAIGDKLVIPQR